MEGKEDFTKHGFGMSLPQKGLDASMGSVSFPELELTNS